MIRSLNTFLILSQLVIAVHGGALCSDNAACSGLVGACCPTSDGISLSCCEGSDVTSESCSDNSACSALGLTGACCPTSEGLYLDCCAGSSGVTTGPQCSAHAACSGVSGECCPTQDGVFLECCYEAAPLTVAACDAYPACQAAGLTGLCCATAEGVYLECCDGLAQQATQCSAHGACSGLLGECCPTTDGVFLDCCNGDTTSSQTRECSSNSACAAIGLEGNCCPPDFGSTNLDCCHGEQTVATPAIGQLCSENSACAAIGLEGSCCPTAHGVQLHCCDGFTSSQTEVEPPVNPPITIKYVTGIPISTPKPSLPPTMAPVAFTVVSPNEVSTSETTGDSGVTLGIEEDENESTQFNEEVPDGVDDGSTSSVSLFVSQQGSSAVGKSIAIWQGLGMVLVVGSIWGL